MSLDTGLSGMVSSLHLLLLLFLSFQASAHGGGQESAVAYYQNLILSSMAPTVSFPNSAPWVSRHYLRSTTYGYSAGAPTAPMPNHHSRRTPQSSPPSTHRKHHHRHHHRRHPVLAPPPAPPPPPPPVPPPRSKSPLSHPPAPSRAYAPRHEYPHPPPGPAAVPHLAPHRNPVHPLPPAESPASPTAKAPVALPPPPQTEATDCSNTVCVPPLTKTPFLSPCGCVPPIQVELVLSAPLYALFPLISVLAAEIANGSVLSPNQVQVTGANTDSSDPDSTIVDVNLVPLDSEFDNLTALLIFQKFWNHEVVINSTLFGNYSTVYVHYRGLPPSPPSAINVFDQNGARGPHEQPLGVNVNKQGHKLGIGTIAVIALSSAIALVVCVGVAWLLLLKCSDKSTPLPPPAEPGLLSARTKRSGPRSILSSDLASSTTLSFTSSMATYASTARTFTFAELDRATERFRPENIIGEGGFGRVYCGVLDDGTKAAVKVLTRDDQQGGKEFVAEVEMLSRLHHRNLVKLIGICTEEHNRCLVYELIPNGSVESHLHGVDKDIAPLDWEARMKIALGAARGLAYLHEDSNPRVIHRDFKASNILLENDFNPKVSDFGLAKVAPDEGSGHLSTRVMGTFGYVAPEYAMTGHLLVKSDVYSYGVVLLELLSGRKPVDMSQPAGQENLVTWARPLLSSREGLELLVDPALQNNLPFDNLARVAAIASMCVQPEVSHRPFMGEVVQALKLVYNDSDMNNGTGSSNVSQGGESGAESDLRAGGRHPWLVNRRAQYAPDSTSFLSVDYDSGPSQGGEPMAGRPVSASAVLNASRSFLWQQSSSLRRHSLSGPLRPSRSKFARYNVRGNQRGSMSEHAGFAKPLGTG